MRGKKNDFSISYYFEASRVLFLGYVHDTNRATAWVNSKGIKWTHYVIYDRRTRALLDVVYNNHYTVYAMVFYDVSGRPVYKMRNVWTYDNAFSYVLSLGVNFSYVNVYDFFTRNYIERIYF